MRPNAHATEMTKQQRSQFWSALPSIARNRPYMALIMTKMTLLAGSTAHTASAAYYVRYIMLRGEGTLAMFLLAHSLGMVVSQFFWLKLIARFGKVPCYVAAASIYAGVSIVWMLLDPALPWQLFVAFSFVNGCGAGGILLIPEALLPDMISRDYAISGVRREGTLASLYTFSEKAAHALGIALTGALLAWYGYAAPATGEALSDNGKWAIVITFGLAPAILVGGSSLWLLSVRRRLAGTQQAEPTEA